MQTLTRWWAAVISCLTWFFNLFVEPPPKRIGLSMGTFNPIHLWHLQVAQCAWDQHELDFVLFIPNGDPPHKKGVVDKFLRLRMVQAAIRGIKHFRVSRVEVDRPGKSYSIDTIKRLRELYGPDVELCLIIGIDNLDQLAKKTWYKTDELLRLPNFRLLIAPRARDLAIREKIAAVLPPGTRFDIIDTPDSNVSSSMIREWYATGRHRSADFLVPNAVRKLINRFRLYLDGDQQQQTD